VEKCIEAVDGRGLEVEGIYRRSGMAAEARQLVQAYDDGMQPNLLDIDIYQDICSITSVLKQYLRSLPQPLVPYDLYADFMEAISLPHNEVKLQTFKNLMGRMPVAHYATLKVLLEHLNRVTRQDKINLMNAKNLSVVFGPTLMRNPDPSREIIDMTFKNMTIEFLIVHTSELFARDERPPTSGIDGSNVERLSTGSNQDPVSTGNSQERPSTNNSTGFVSSVSALSGSSASGRLGLNGATNQPSPPPRRLPVNLSLDGPSPPSELHIQPSIFSTRTSSGESTSSLASTSGQPTQPLQQMMPQPQPYQPVSQYRPQQHQTLQQLHQKQQQIQLQLHLQQQKQQQPEQQQSLLTAPSSANPQTLTHPNYIPTPQQQHANPEVDMTHFP